MSAVAVKNIVINEKSLTTFGYQVSSKISENSRKIMEHVSSKKLGTIGEDLKNLVLSLEKNSLDKIGNKSLIGKLFGKAKYSISELQVNLKQVQPQIDMIVKKLKDHTYELEKELTILDDFDKFNLENIKELQEFKKVGKEKLKELEEVTLADLKNKAMENPDSEFLINQEILQVTNFKDRLKKRLLELEQVQTICLQTTHQISMIKSGHHNMIAKIADCENIALPAWRTAFTIAVVSETQKDSLKTVGLISDFTNELIKKNADNLYSNSKEISEQASSTLIKTDVLKYSVEKLSATFKEVAEIYNSNMSILEDSQKELEDLQKDIMDINK